MFRAPVNRISTAALKAPRTISGPSTLTRTIVTTRYTRDQNVIEYDSETKIATVSLVKQQTGEERQITQLPKLGRSVPLGGTVGSYQSSQGAVNLVAPLSGTVTEINEQVDGTAEQQGWLFKIRAVRPTEVESLMTKAEYLQFLEDNLDASRREQIRQEIQSSSGPKWRQLHRYQQQLLAVAST